MGAASRAYAPSPSRQLTRPGRLRAEEILLCFFPLRSGAVLVFYYQKSFLSAIDSDQVRHHLPRHGQCCVVGIAFLFLLFVYHRQCGAISRRHFCRLNQNRLQMFVALFRQWRAHRDIGRIFLRTTHSAVADGLLDRRKSLHVANFQRPGQRGDRANRRRSSAVPRVPEAKNRAPAIAPARFPFFPGAPRSPGTAATTVSALHRCPGWWPAVHENPTLWSFCLL